MTAQAKKGHPPEKKRNIGEFCWIDIAVADISKEISFFKKVFHWEVKEIPMDKDNKYSMIFSGQDSLGGFMDLKHAGPGTPPHVGCTIRVSECEKTFQNALKNGAKELHKPSPVGDMGIIAAIADPSGAGINIWEAKKHEGMSTNPMAHGSPSWFELMTDKADICKKFYKQTFNWDCRRGNSPGVEYFEFHMGTTMIGGLFPLTKNIKMPNSWATYFTVKNIESSLETAQKLGSKIVVPITDAGQIGQFAGLTSPQGVYFGLVQYR